MEHLGSRSALNHGAGVQLVSRHHDPGSARVDRATHIAHPSALDNPRPVLSPLRVKAYELKAPVFLTRVLWVRQRTQISLLEEQER